MQAQRQEVAADPNLGQTTYRSIEVYIIIILINIVTISHNSLFLDSFLI